MTIKPPPGKHRGNDGGTDRGDDGGATLPSDGDDDGDGDGDEQRGAVDGEQMLDDAADAANAGGHVPEKAHEVVREAELISFPGGNAGAGRGIDHLKANRSLIVRRSLLATAVGGVVPIPVMDDYLAGRVRAGMLMQIADRRKVDLMSSGAELLADPREGTAARNATMTAATLLALKLAWRKFFIVLGAGRRAEEMATTFQVGTLFDHFCAKTHVGAGLDRAGAVRIRAAVFASIRESERAALVGVFQEGGRVLGRSIGEAPAWVSRQLQRAVEQYVATGGNPDTGPVDLPRHGARGADQNDAGSEDGDADGNDPARESGDPADIDPDARWLDRAAAVIEDRLGRMGSGYIEALVRRFDHHMAKDPAPQGGTASRA